MELSAISYQLSEKRKEKVLGFSLIELLVVMTISMILLGVGFMGFKSISEDRNLKRAEKELRSLLYEAKQGAFYGKKPSNGDCANGFLGNRITIVGNAVKSEYYCKNSFNVNVYYLGKTLNFENLTPTSGDFTFYSVGSETKTNLGTNDFDFVLDPGGKNIIVKVTPNGEIR